MQNCHPAGSPHQSWKNKLPKENIREHWHPKTKGMDHIHVHHLCIWGKLWREVVNSRAYCRNTTLPCLTQDVHRSYLVTIIYCMSPELSKHPSHCRFNDCHFAATKNPLCRTPHTKFPHCAFSRFCAPPLAGVAPPFCRQRINTWRGLKVSHVIRVHPFSGLGISKLVPQHISTFSISFNLKGATMQTTALRMT